MNKKEIIDQLAESRQAFLHALEGLQDDQINQAPVEGTWTIKDLLAHLASWENTCLVPLRIYSSGGEFVPDPIPNHDVWNQAQAQRWQSQTLAETLADYQSIREEFVALISALPDACWNVKLPAPWGGEATIAELCSGLAWHEKTEHLKSIQHWKKTGMPR